MAASKLRFYWFIIGKATGQSQVAGSKNDAGLRGRPERHLEVDRTLLTCAQGWGNGHGCTLGTHADELDVLSGL